MAVEVRRLSRDFVVLESESAEAEPPAARPRSAIADLEEVNWTAVRVWSGPQ